MPKRGERDEGEEEMMEKFPHLDLVVMEDVALDVSSGESIARFAERFNEKIGELDVLVNNAGVAAAKGYEKETGVSKLVWTNFLGPAVLTLSLSESFQRAIERRQSRTAYSSRRCVIGSGRSKARKCVINSYTTRGLGRIRIQN